MKTVSRSAGRSATAAAAYRAGARIECEREGRVHDYARRSGVAHAEIIVPGEANWAMDRSALWNAAERYEKRSNSTVAREYELALPDELSARGRVELALAFGRELADRYGVAADIAIHAPGRRGDQRNWHAHVLTTTRRVEAEGLGKKTRVLDDQKSGPAEVTQLRAVWAEMTNRFLEEERCAARVDHRSLEAQRVERIEQAAAFTKSGQARAAVEAELDAAVLDRAPQIHVGVVATAMERKAMRAAIETGEVYEPATDLGAMRAAAEAQKAERVRISELARQALDGLRQLRDRVEALWGRAEAAWSRTMERFGPAAFAAAWTRREAGEMEPASEGEGPVLGGFTPSLAAVTRESVPAAKLRPRGPEIARRLAAAQSGPASPPAGPVREAAAQDPLAEALALAREILAAKPEASPDPQKPPPKQTPARARPEVRASERADAPTPEPALEPSPRDAARRAFSGQRELARAREIFAAERAERLRAQEEARLAAEAQEKAFHEAKALAEAEAAAAREHQEQELRAEQDRQRAQRDHGHDFGM